LRGGLCEGGGGEVCRRDLQCLLTSKVFDAMGAEEEEERVVVLVCWCEERRVGGLW